MFIQLILGNDYLNADPLGLQQELSLDSAVQFICSDGKRDSG